MENEYKVFNTQILTKLFDSIYGGEFGKKLKYYESIFVIKPIISSSFLEIKHDTNRFFINYVDIVKYDEGNPNVRSINDMFTYFEILDRNRKLKDITNDL